MVKLPIAVIVGAAILDVPAGPVDASVFARGSTPAQIRLGFGGDALNEATALARLGVPVRLVSKVGDDAAGRLVLEHCRAAGVDTRYVRVEEGLATGVNIVLVDETGERCFITDPNGSLRRLAPADIDPAALEEAGLLCLASAFVSPLLGPAGMAALFAAAKERGLVTCADFTTPKNGEGLGEMGAALSQLDYAFPNLAEAAALTGLRTPEKIAAALLGAGAGHVVLKMGGEGCYIASREGARRLPAVAGIRPLDATGAGDGFVAGFLSALLAGQPFEECALTGNAAASLVVEAFGAGGGLTGPAPLQERLERYQTQLR